MEHKFLKNYGCISLPTMILMSSPWRWLRCESYRQHLTAVYFTVIQEKRILSDAIKILSGFCMSIKIWSLWGRMVRQ